MADPHSPTRMYPGNFDQMALPEAVKDCRPYDPDRAVGERCEVCRMAVILHCDECKIQITGCLCTEERNHGPEIARQRLKDRGIWMPEWDESNYDPNRPIDPRSLHG